MFTRRPRTARELVSKAGRLPLIAALGMLTLPSFVWAQAPAAPAPRDPMKVQNAAADDKGKAKVSVSEHMTVDLHLKDEDLANVLELLSIQTQKNIVASKGVSGKVTATLYGVTFYQALDAILHVNGFGYVENGNFIFVYTNEELKGRRRPDLDARPPPLAPPSPPGPRTHLAQRPRPPTPAAGVTARLSGGRRDPTLGRSG